MSSRLKARVTRWFGRRIAQKLALCLSLPMGRTYAVYIVANRRRGTLYVGVTNDLVRRMHGHREGMVEGFTRKHGCKHLVWFETVEDIAAAIAHEKRLKKWLRAWKDDLIEKTNPDWRDLWWDIIGPQPPFSPTPDVIPALSRDPS